MKKISLNSCWECPHNKGYWCGYCCREVPKEIVKIGFPPWCILEEDDDAKQKTTKVRSRD